MSANPAPLALARPHLESLRARGLNDESIRLAHLHTESDPERLRLMLNREFPIKHTGIVIPFFGITGDPVPYRRVRWLPTWTRAGGDEARYDSPSDTATRIYFPPRVRQVRDDTSARIIIVEGEFKAIAADQHGAATIAICGVAMWSEPRTDEQVANGEGRTLHKDLLNINWKGRVVYIAFDSDTLYKNGPRYEEWTLSQALGAAGAIVKIIRIPSRLGGPKVGLDDFLAAAGPKAPDELARLMREAQFPSLPPIGFTNSVRRPTEDDEIEDSGRSVVEMASELVGRSGGWPRNVGGVLVGPDAEKGTRAIASANMMSAFIRSLYDTGCASGCTWLKSPQHPTQAEFYAYLESNCERFDRADMLPHVPPIPGVLYTRPTPSPDGKFTALEKFLSFFQPATTEDASLLLAAVLTPFWGGPPGKRPAMLIEGEENDPEAGRGIGKTTIAQKIAGLAGGAFEIDAGEAFTRTRSRLLTPEAGSYRVLLMDNVKTFRLSNSDLESLITNPHINGHRLYHGQAGVLNYYTLFITLNGASLSKDVAQRVVTLRMKRVKNRKGWEAELDAFVAKSRQQIIGDIVGMLRRPAASLPNVSRWGPWEAEVLARVENPAACWELIRERSGQHDADSEDAERIRETLREVVERHDSSNIHDRCFLLTSAAVTKLIGLSINNRYIPAGHASATIKALGVKGFRQSHRNGQRLWEWRGDNVGHTPPSKVLTFNPDPEHRRDELTGKTMPVDPWSFREVAEVAGG